MMGNLANELGVAAWRFSAAKILHCLWRGAVPDQAALFGILASIRNLNLILVSLCRLPQSPEK